MITVKNSKKRYHRNEIVQTLESFILDNGISGGSRLPGTAQLSTQFNVSEKTIHRAMDKLVEKRVLYRVRGQGTFVCDHIKPKRVSSVALLRINNGLTVLPGLDRIAFDNFFDDLEYRLREEENCKVSVIRVSRERDYMDKLVSLEFFDCIVAAAGWLELLPQLFDCAKRVVLIQDSEFHYGNFNQILVDYVPGFRKMLRYFKTLGQKKFFVAGVTTDTSRHRYESLMLAAQLEGFRPEQLHLYQSSEPYYANIVAAGNDCAARYLSEFDLSCAVISLSDYIALGMVDAFERHGIRPGVDMAMVSYDNLLWQLPEFSGKFTFHSIAHPVDPMIDATVQVCRNVVRAQDPKFSCTLTVPSEEFIVYDEKTDTHAPLN